MLSKLEVGQVVLVQNQTGNNPLRWGKSGQIVEVLGFDQYKVKIDGSGRLSLRNRRFLRPITPYTSMDQSADGIGMEVSDEVREDQGEAAEPSNVRRSTRTRRAPDRFGLT